MQSGEREETVDFPPEDFLSNSSFKCSSFSAKCDKTADVPFDLLQPSVLADSCIGVTGCLDWLAGAGRNKHSCWNYLSSCCWMNLLLCLPFLLRRVVEQSHFLNPISQKKKNLYTPIVYHSYFTFFCETKYAFLCTYVLCREA